MPRTSGTRPKGTPHGSRGDASDIPARGVGWGGPAKGAQTRSLEDRVAEWLELTPQQRRERKAKRAVQHDDHLDLVDQVVHNDPAQRVNAAMAFAKMAGFIVERSEHSGTDGQPMTFTFRWATEAEAKGSGEE